MILRHLAPLVLLACSSSASAPATIPVPANDQASDAGPTPPPYPSNGETTLVVGVDMEDFHPTLGMSLEKIHVVAKVDGQTAQDETIDVRSGGSLPHETKLVAPKGKKDAPVEVTVEGFAPTFGVPRATPEANVVRLVTTRFVPDEARVIPIRLEARCLSKGPDAVGGVVFLGPTCNAPETCIAATCTSAAIDPQKLPRYGPTWEADMPDACRASAATLALGTGENAYAPLKDGDTVQLVEGPQCGHHIWMGVKMGGLRQFDTRTTISSVQPGTPVA